MYIYFEESCTKKSPMLNKSLQLPLKEPHSTSLLIFSHFHIFSFILNLTKYDKKYYILASSTVNFKIPAAISAKDK